MLVKPLSNKIIVDEFLKGERKVGSIIVTNDDGKSSGVRPRWAHVYAVGSNITDIKPGNWILITHGRWTRQLTIEHNSEKHYFWGVEYKSIMVVSDVFPEFDTFGDDIGIEYVNTRMPKTGEKFGVDEY